jgi:CheY-like chemotaxis protein
MRVLVVDDNTEFLRAARFLLKQLGHEPVGLARSCDEGLALAEGLRPDVVLMDLGHMDHAAVEAAGCLRGRPGGAPVIAIASRNDEVSQHRSAEAGCAAFIPKADLADDLPRVLTRLAAAGVGRVSSLPWGDAEPVHV